MASTFSNLGLILMATGEDSGTWGYKTNVNIQRIDFAMDGIAELTITGSTTLAFSTNSDTTTYTQEAGRAGILVLSGTPGAIPTITVPNIEKQYLVNNTMSTSATFTAGTGASTVTVGAGAKTIIYVDGSDEVIEGISATNPGGSNTQVQFNSSGSFGGSANLTWDGSNIQIGAQGDLRLADGDSSNYIAIQAPTTVGSNVTLTLPDTAGSADQALVTNGSGVLSWSTISGGASWQAVITADPANAVAGNGYFCNTTGGAFTVTLPTTATIGDFISFIDYAGTFDTNNLTIGRNGHNIQGSAADLTVATERAGFTLVYVDSTQGWLLQNN